jgi:hypothetical protein
MDGVLVDLNNSLFNVLNKTIKNYIDNPSFFDNHNKKLIDNAIQSLNNKPLKLSQMYKDKSTPEIIELSFHIMSNNKEFWSNLFWHKEGPQLWHLLSSYDVKLLTVPIDKVSEEGKVEWAQKCLKFSRDKILFCSDGKKEIYAQDNTLLIDDLPKNVLNFQLAGGKAILYTTFRESLPVLLHHLPY